MTPETQNRLFDSIEKLGSKIDKLSENVSEIKERNARNEENVRYVQDLKAIATIPQFNKLFSDVNKFSILKQKAIGVMIAVQFIGGVVMWYINR